MRHERPQPGRPTPVETVNATLIAKKLAGPAAMQARAELDAQATAPAEIRAAVVADMVELLDEGRISRGYADIYDLSRAGYRNELAATLGPQAAKLLARRVAERDGDDGLDGGDMEAA